MPHNRTSPTCNRWSPFLSCPSCKMFIFFIKIQKTIIVVQEYSYKTSSTSHNSDLRDSHEYTQKYRNKCGVSGFLQGSIAGCLDQKKLIGLVEPCNIVIHDSAHPTYLETICIYCDVTQIWGALRGHTLSAAPPGKIFLTTAPLLRLPEIPKPKPAPSLRSSITCIWAQSLCSWNVGFVKFVCCKDRMIVQQIDRGEEESY